MCVVCFCLVFAKSTSSFLIFLLLPITNHPKDSMAMVETKNKREGKKKKKHLVFLDPKF